MKQNFSVMITTGICCMVIVLMACIASAGQFGPVEPTAQPGGFSLGVGYFFDDVSWGGTELFGLDTNTIRAESNQYYLQGSYAISKNLEIYGRLGMADIKGKGDDDLSDDNKLFGSIGVRSVLYSNEMFSFGIFGQASKYSDYSDSMSSGPATVDFKIKDYYNMSAGLSGQIKYKDFAVYGGPYWSYSTAKFEAEISARELSRDDSDSITDNTMGGFIGINIPLTKAMRLNLEGQIRDHVSFGALLSYSF